MYGGLSPMYRWTPGPPGLVDVFSNLVVARQSPPNINGLPTIDSGPPRRNKAALPRLPSRVLPVPARRTLPCPAASAVPCHVHRVTASSRCLVVRRCHGQESLADLLARA